MHEYSLAAEIVKISLTQLEQAKQAQPESMRSAVSGPKLTGLKLKIGTLAGVFPDSLCLYLEIIFKDNGLGPVAVEIESVPARFHCRCGHVYTADLLLSPCPACSGFERELIEGNQCMIESIELTDTGTVPSTDAAAG